MTFPGNGYSSSTPCRAVHEKEPFQIFFYFLSNLLHIMVCCECDPLPTEGWHLPVTNLPVEKLVMTISRTFDSTISVLNARSKLYKKDQRETICAFQSKDGTRATTDNTPSIVVKRKYCEQTIIRKDAAVETIIDRRETFSIVLPLDSLIQSETPDSVAPTDETLEIEVDQSIVEVEANTKVKEVSDEAAGSVVAEVDSKSKTEPDFEALEVTRHQIEIEKFAE